MDEIRVTAYAADTELECKLCGARFPANQHHVCAGIVLTPSEAALALKSVETRIRMMEDGLLPSSEDTYGALCALAERLTPAHG